MGTIMGAMIGSTVIGVPIGAFLSEIEIGNGHFIV